ncbi:MULTISPECIES: pentapeptide repeat-containing protein [unclassified Rhodococcus (in: high G+C Gram-positive bacteria)]|uniref:pentapeptide repeat-containing protein n=1 Tax=unclassified Rhodococcus (in: high G+C Gram-positive bacteria) TaxID=192944 RepID=UPI0015C5F563|nr:MULTISPECIES: pentapeptide repeat-containing protein [unclassified Rhodococcus (in: high G+C Gram-positive bacteria)]
MASTVFFSMKTLQASTDQNELSGQIAISERYTTAVELLSSDDITSRVGGIYALKTIQDESAERAAVVTSLLSAFARTFSADGTEIMDGTDQKCPRPSMNPFTEQPMPDAAGIGRQTDAEGVIRSAYQPPSDLQAAATVLAQQPQSLPNDSPTHADFGSSCLVGITFRNASLSSVDFGTSTITGADFTGASLSGAKLSHVNSSLTFTWAYIDPGATFDDADLSYIDFRGTDARQLFKWSMKGANLNHAVFDGVDMVDPIYYYRYNPPELSRTLSSPKVSTILNDESNIMHDPGGYRTLFAGADLKGASFRFANFAGADLSLAVNLEQADLTGIYYNRDTSWPEGFTPPPSAYCFLQSDKNCPQYLPAK